MRVRSIVIFLLFLFGALFAGLAAIADAASAQQVDVVRIVITADKQSAGSDGWLQFSDGTKQWLSPDCRDQLEADGVALAILPWAEIDGMPDGPQRPCEELRPSQSTPDAVIDAPAPNSTTSSPVMLRGTASDNVGVSRVRLTVYQVGSLHTWNGSTFSEPFTTVDAALASPNATDTQWSYELDDVSAGRVVFTALAYNAAGNVDPTKQWRLFTVSNGDLTPPEGNISAPASNSSTSAPVTLRGDASDNVGVSRVRLTIYQAGTSRSWNGNSFTDTYTTVDATLDQTNATNTNWSYQLNGAPAGQVVFTALAYDTTGNIDPTKPWRLFTISNGDLTPPNADISAPATGADVSNPVALRGSASDNVGVSRVRLTIYQAGTSRSWNGNSFTDTYTTVDATLDQTNATNTNWSYQLNGAPAGQVVFTALAYDTTGNIDPTKPWRLFTTSNDGASNLAMILSNDTRNTQFDNNPFRGVPADQIAVSDLTVDGDIYNEALLSTENSGYFRVKCEVSHFAYDDPIVYPNQPGRAHLHMFFGNTEAHAYSTYDSLLNSGTGTCNGEDLNRTSYWVPAMLDSDGNALIPYEIMVYYKNDNFRLGNANELVVPFPDNLRMIAGNGGATSPQTTPSGGASNTNSLPVVSFNCGRAYGDNVLLPLIPDCSGDGNVLEMKVAFRQCLDEDTGLYQPDQSHMSYSEGGYYGARCPASHSTDLSSIMYRIFYRPAEYGGTLTGLHLSSDIKPNEILPGGTTSHADWFGAWHPETMALWIENCNNTQADCELGLLGRDPAVSLVQRKRGFYPYGYRAMAEELIKLCPGKELDPSNRLRSVAGCRHG